LAGLIAAIESVDHQDEHLGEQDLLEEFDDPEADYPRGSTAVYDGDTMVGGCVLRPRTRAEPVHEMPHFGGVHPAYRERGIGSALLDWAERAAVPLHERRFPGHRLTLVGQCLARNDGAVTLFREHGYRQTRWFLRMSYDLANGLPAARVPAGIDIVGFTADRSQDARLVRDDAFRDHWGSTEDTDETWAHFIASQAFRPAYSFLAYDGSEPLGLIVSHEYDSYTRATGRRELYIPTVATRRAGRGRGIATALLSQALHAARSDGLVKAVLDVDADSPTGAVGLYQRAGFVVTDTSISHVKPLIDWPSG
jgi:mycothiol synthase